MLDYCNFKHDLCLISPSMFGVFPVPFQIGNDMSGAYFVDKHSAHTHKERRGLRNLFNRTTVCATNGYDLICRKQYSHLKVGI